MKIIIEFIKYILKQKKYWLLPLIITLILIGGALILTSGTVIAPFIYTIF